MIAPESLTLVRHGESTGNTAHRRAHETGAETADIPERDADVPLTPVGREQAAALGRRLAELAPDRRPTHIVVSPYLRARDTLAIALEHAGFSAPIRVDERLRDRDAGAFEGLTKHGVLARHPAEAARLAAIGKFYYRPPGGESWTDIALRLRSLYRDVADDFPDGRVLAVAHDAVVALTRYVVEDLSEREILEIERDLVRNASLSVWERRGGRLVPVVYNDASHLTTIPSR